MPLRLYIFLFTWLTPMFLLAQDIDTVLFINCYSFTPADKEFGGISGIEMINDSCFYALSDRNGLYTCSIHYNSNGIGEIRLLRQETGVNKLVNTDDLESVRYAGGSIYLSDEQKNEIYVVDEQNRKTTIIPLPYPLKSGILYNKGIEGMFIHKNSIWLINEKPIKTDDDILRLSKLNANGVLQKQYAYPYDTGKAGEDGMCVTEILPYDDTHIISLERTYNRNKDYNIIKLFSVDISRADDIDAKRTYKPVSKTCIATLDQDFRCRPGVNMKNLEGMVWLKNKEYLLLVCDNNFLIPQTDFYMFRVVPKKITPVQSTGVSSILLMIIVLLSSYGYLLFCHSVYHSALFSASSIFPCWQHPEVPFLYPYK